MHGRHRRFLRGFRDLEGENAGFTKEKLPCIAAREFLRFRGVCLDQRGALIVQSIGGGGLLFCVSP